MDNELDNKQTTSEPTLTFSLRYLDKETMEILIEDKIATGG